MTVRHFLACAIAALCLALIGGAALLGTNRHAGLHFVEARR